MPPIKSFRFLACIALTAILAGVFFLTAQADQPIPLRMIVVNSAAEAAKLQEQLQNGADFGVLAREISTDPTSIEGGLLGNVDPATLRAEIREAVMPLAPGAVSNVFRLPSGFAIVKRLPPNEIAELEVAQTARRTALSAEGSIRFDFDISGLNEAEAALAGIPKPADWYRDLNSACSARRESYAGAQARVQQLLAEATGRPAVDLMSLQVAKGQLSAYVGKLTEALEPWEAAYKMATTDLPRAIPYLEELLGIGYLHQAQIDNEVYRKPGDRCLLPMSAFSKPANSEKAVAHFLRFLKERPDDLEVKWLLNVAYMTLGKYPAGVPKEFLIPPSVFVSKEDIGRFKDVAPAAGVNVFLMAAGVIVDDFDNDGLFDIVTSNFDICGAMHFFHNNGDGTFADRTEKAGLGTQLGGLNIIQADFNNDGCTDILVLRGGWEIAQRLSLLRNNCNGTFTDVTKESGLAEMALATQTAAWTDINNDGLLDLYIGNENGPNQLYLNKGNGKFENISHSAGVDITAFTKAVVADDYDNDGWPDLYVSNYRGENALFHNNHDGTFTDIAKQAGVLGSGHGFPAWFFDYDNDGWPDLFVSSYFMSVDETARTWLGLPHNAGTTRLYKNLGNGAFRDVTVEAGLDKVFMPMGSNFGDVDNDGYLDIYLGTGDPSYASLTPNVMFHNKGGKSFVDITASSGTGDMHKGHGVAFADIDSDGDEDLLTVIGGATPGDAHAFRLFENPGHGNDWVSLRLRGVKSNRAAIGARIKVTVKTAEGATRTIYRTVGSGGSFGASPLEQHIGLGKSAQIQGVQIRWPGGPEQTLTNIVKNQAFEITEASPEIKKIARTAVHLGGR